MKKRVSEAGGTFWFKSGEAGRRRGLLLVATAMMSGLIAAGLARAGTVSLGGSWRFQLDREDAGVRENWFERVLTNKARLPGSLPEQGIGDDISTDTPWMGDIVDRSWFTEPQYAKYRQPGKVKVPFWLQPDKYYAGAAWFQREIQIPRGWRGQRVVLFLERPHWETRVWVDGTAIGTNNSLSTPHQYELGSNLAPGRHRLTIRVDNRLIVDVGVNSHSISDHTQGNWNGIVGRIELRSGAPVWVDDLEVSPDSARKSIRIRAVLYNASRKPAEGKISWRVEAVAGAGLRHALPVTETFNTPAEKIELPESELELGTDARLWDEFSPAVYRLRGEVRGEIDGKRFVSEASTTFGLHDISTDGTQFALNGRKIFVRGTLECCIFPKTGHPPTDVESWKRIIRIAKAHGLNLIRFHSWCPPEAAFAAADELGFYYQVEIASWANQSTTLGDGKPVDGWLYEEADRILRASGNHPSFLLMPYGNEPGGKNAGAYLKKWLEHWKARDPRRLYTSGSGWPVLPENQFHVVPDPRVQHWGAGLTSRINARPPETVTDYRDYIQGHRVPAISHEIGEWCVYPNFEEMPKYTGYLKPKNFEIFRDSLEEHHLGRLSHQFLLASGKLQTLCYKEDIESALRTPGMGGFELLDLHDFPGQGTALVGVLDPFWDDKGYVTAEEYRRFCNSTVPLARLTKRVFSAAETLEAKVEVAHFGPAPLVHAATDWRLVGGDKKVYAQGQLPDCDIPIGNGIALGTVRLRLKDLPVPKQYKLVLKIRSGKAPKGESQFENDWDIWVYPRPVDDKVPEGVTIADELNDAAVAELGRGGKVLLLVPPNRVRGDALGKVELGFSSIFWNTAWTHRQPPHTLGILCNPRDPALAQFPTEYHSNWQWWYLVSRAGAMILEALPADLRPTVQVIDDWVTNRKLGLVFEARVGGGKLMVCSIDLKDGLEENPVARQMRQSLLTYMASSRFRPAVSVSAAQVRELMTPGIAH